MHTRSIRCVVPTGLWSHSYFECYQHVVPTGRNCSTRSLDQDLFLLRQYDFTLLAIWLRGCGRCIYSLCRPYGTLFAFLFGCYQHVVPTGRICSTRSLGQDLFLFRQYDCPRGCCGLSLNGRALATSRRDIILVETAVQF